MSQIFSIRRVKHQGAPVYIGEVEGVDAWSGNPERIMQWLCDGYRFRFNQHRALRQTTTWVEDPEYPSRRIALRDEAGEKVLRTLGADPVRLKDSEVRQQFPHLAALPMQVLQHPERVENTEWWAAVKRRRTLRDKGVPAGAMPRFRSAKRGDLRFGIWFNGGKNAVLTRTGRRSGVLTIKGQNPTTKRGSAKGLRWTLRVTVRLSAEVIPYTSVEVDWSRKRVVLISPAPAREHPTTGAAVGIDRGVTHSVATSDGTFYDLPRRRDVERRRKAHQRAMARSREVAMREGRDWRTSRRRAEHRRLAAKHSTTLANVRKDFAEQVSHRLIRDHDLIVFESLSLPAMTRSARGTALTPGKRVRQKTGLNRALLDSALGMLLTRTQDKASRTPGRRVALVSAPHTSQRCARCGHIDPKSRESQAVFRCTRCGHTANADTNAGENVLARELQGWASPAGRGRQTTYGEAVPATPVEPQTPALPT